jgi:ribosomal protein S27AE
MMHCPKCGRQSFEAIESFDHEAGYECFKCGFKAEAESLDDVFAQEEEEIA